MAYSYRKEMAAKTISYDGPHPQGSRLGPGRARLHRVLVPRYFGGVPRVAEKSRFQERSAEIYNAGVRVQLSQPTPELQLAEYENIKKWVDVTDRLGASHMRVFGGNAPKGATEQQALAWAAEVLKRGAEYAGSKGITLGVEDDYGLTVAAAPTIEIVKQAASPWAGINADSGNLKVGWICAI